MLAEHFVRPLEEQNNWKLRKLSAEAIAELERYSWPGNVRELRNVVERVLLLAPGDMVEAETVQRALPAAAGAAGTAFGVGGGTASARIALEMGTLAQRVEAFERETLLAELKLHHHHMTNTAKALGLERSHLYKKCQQLGIDLRAIRQTD
jgi:two-component system, NtrC family, nitrogen regulation response regulator NtrX